MKWLAAGLLALLALGAAGVALVWAPDRPPDSLKARWAAPPSTFVALEGMQVHVRDVGPRDDPVPVLLIHGTAASLHTWEGWVSALKATRRVITFDLPAFGLTGPAPDADYTPARYAKFVLGLMDTLGVARAVVGGNSLGGEIAWHVALTAPARVERLVLVDAGGFPLAPASVPLGFRLARMPGVNRLMANVLPRAVIESSVKNVYGDPARVTPELVDRYYELALREGNRKALVTRFSQIGREDPTARLAALRVPTLILWGGRDRLIPPADGERFARAIAGSRLVLFNDLGHVPHEEDAGRTLAALLPFIAR